MKDKERTREQLIKELEELWQKNAFLSLILDSVPVVLYTCTVGGDFGATYISKNISALTGYKPEDFTSNAEFWFSNVHPDDQEMVNINLANLLETGKVKYEYRWKTADGSYKWFNDISRLIMPNSGETSYIIGMFIDITNRKKAENTLLDSNKDWENIFNTITDMITIHDRDFNIIKSNKAAENLLNLPDLEKVFNAKCFSYYHGTDSPPQGCPSCDCINTGKPCNFEIFEPYLNTSVEIRVIPRLNSDNQIDGLIHVARDISERKKMQEQLEALSLTDELTGLYNRRGFFSFAERELKLANRRKEGVLLIYADLDYLKAINDGFGHQKGDILLVEAANLLKDIFRESDIIARIGGDEFVVFSIGATNMSNEALRARFEEGIENYNKNRDHIFKLSMSIGIIQYNEECSYSVDDLLVQADLLMYENKRQRGSIDPNF